MPRFYGAVGYVETRKSKKRPDVYETNTIIERRYYGDVLKAARGLESGDGLNDELTVSNKISILADAYAYEHFFAIRYVKWAGTLWKVTNVEVQRPRLILTLGGEYNAYKGPTPTRDN